MNIASHTDSHGTIHGVEAIGKPSNRSANIRLVTDKLRWTLWVRQLKRIEIESSTFVVILALNIVTVWNYWFVLFVEDIAVLVHKFHSSSHVLMNLQHRKRVMNTGEESSIHRK